MTSSVRTAAAVLVTAALWGCGGEEDTRPNVVFIAIDTLRVDHVGDVADPPTGRRLWHLGCCYRQSRGQHESDPHSCPPG